MDKVTLDPHGPRGTTGPTNREKLIGELNDLLGVADMLVERGELPANWMDPARQARKKKRVYDYIEYARRVGALQ